MLCQVFLVATHKGGTRKGIEVLDSFEELEDVFGVITLFKEDSITLIYNTEDGTYLVRMLLLILETTTHVYKDNIRLVHIIKGISLYKQHLNT
jgi:hypothetical protein